jgi:hypothetical protein
MVISRGKPKELGGIHASLTLRSPCSYQITYKSSDFEGLKECNFPVSFPFKNS